MPTIEPFKTQDALWHTLPHEDAFKQLQSSPNGLNHEEAKLRLKKFGLNHLQAFAPKYMIQKIEATAQRSL